MPTTTRHGIPIHYEVTGQGAPAVVLLHSYLCSGYMWHNQVDALALRCTVVNIDARGHGRSGPVPETFPLGDLVGDVVQVLDVEGISSAVWVGLSIGGMVALHAALSVPDRVRGLVILDSDAGAERVASRLKYAVMAAVVRRFGVGPMMKPILRLMFGRTTLGSRHGLVAEWAARFEQVDVPSMLNTLPALVRRPDLLPRLGEIRVPTLVLVGQEDRSLPPALSRRMASAIPGSTLVEVPGAGHLSVLEEPERLTGLIEGFVAEVRASG